MVVNGHGRQIYNAELQRQYQARSIGGFGTLYAHPPFEVLLFLFAAWLPLKHAYLLWFLMSLGFLLVALRRLARDSLLAWEWTICFAVSLTFVPVLLCLQQGQDSLLVLLPMIYGFAALRGNRPFSAGCWLGLALCKFQIVLPLVLVLLFTQSGKSRRGLLAAFSLVALVLVAASIAVCGWSVFLDYPRFLLALQASGVTPRAMANLRGLAYFFHPSDHAVWNIAVVSILSAVALIRTLMVWKSAPQAAIAGAPFTREHFDFAFASTVLFALLASYYLNPHDLTLLLLPVVLMLNLVLAGRPALSSSSNWLVVGQFDPRVPFAPEIPRAAGENAALRNDAGVSLAFTRANCTTTNWLLILLLGILFFPPVPLVTLIAHTFCLFSLPVIALFLTKPPTWRGAGGNSLPPEIG